MLTSRWKIIVAPKLEDYPVCLCISISPFVYSCGNCKTAIESMHIQMSVFNVDNVEADCQRRWRNLRDGYVRYKKSLKCSGSAGNKRHKDPIYGSMSFLDGFLKHRRLVTLE